MFSYDELPYEDNAYYHTHPSNLAVVATLCGLNPPPVTNARVLELGCGTGFNLLAMAFSLPQAHFVGVDLSPKQIEHGQALIAKLKIDRIKLHALDVANLDPALGQFDYIIAHGLFSWVPAETRHAILKLCKCHLAPTGVAYLSYNTYPGWHTRTILREALQFHTPPDGPLLEQVQKAKVAVEQMVKDLPDQDSHYAGFLRTEIEALRNDSDICVAHDLFELHNQPFHFIEFAGMANENGLRFVAEARFETNSFSQSPEMQKTLHQTKGDLLRREQLHDFLRNRSFRQTLLCHHNVQPTWSPSLQTLGNLRLHCQVELLSTAEEQGKVTEQFRLNKRNIIATADPILRGMLHILHDSWPRMVACKTMTTQLIARLGPNAFAPNTKPEVHIAQLILRGYTDHLWLLFASEPPYASNAGKLPQACPLARHEAEKLSEVTNRLHRPVKLNEDERKLLQLLDGQTPRDQLLSSLQWDEEKLKANMSVLAESALLVN